jgi:hypothetical protein
MSRSYTAHSVENITLNSCKYDSEIWVGKTETDAEDMKAAKTLARNK